MRPINHDLVNRLENWGRAMRSPPTRLCARSFEGRYRSPQPWEPAPPHQRPKTDLQDAQTIEQGVCSLPIFHHALLRSWYVYSHNPARALRIAAKAANEPRPPPRTFLDNLNTAHQLLQHALTIPLVTRKQRAREIVLAHVKLFAL